MHRILALGLLAIVAASAQAAGDAEAGKAKSASCSICHGADGKAQIPIYPRLAGQNHAYLVNAIRAYKSGDRKGPTAGLMTPNVMALSDEDIDDLAAFYHSLQP